MGNQGAERLCNQVIDTGLCTFCGACSGLCPYLRPFGGRIAVLGKCEVGSSRCVDFCPRTGIDLERTSEALFDLPYDDKPLGHVRGVFIARATDPEILGRAQYGGTVSALLCLALSTRLVGEAVLAKSVNWEPAGTVVRDRAGVLECAGSNYIASPILNAFNRIPMGGGSRIAVVGTPCQMLALAKMRGSALASRGNIGRLGFTIGLFCTWALSHSFLKKLNTVAPGSVIRKVDIPPPPANLFEVHTSNGIIQLPLEEVRPFIPPACSFCHDMTAEMADLSVGSAEGIPGWNTVIVRTERGAALLDQAVAEGVLEAAELPKANFDHLSQASLLKKRRALRRLVDKTQQSDDLLYLKMDPTTALALLEG